MARSITKRAVAVSIVAALFAAALLVPSALLPYAELSPMLIVVGIAVPTGLGYAIWQWFNYVAARCDVRVVRQVQRETREDLR